MDLRKRKSVSYAEKDAEEDEVLSKHLKRKKNNVCNEPAELAISNTVVEIPTSSISIYKNTVSGYLDEIKNRDLTIPVGEDSHYQFVHDCISISKSEVQQALGVLLDDFWWPCEFVTESSSNTHKVIFDTGEGCVKAGIHASKLPEEINEVPIDKDSYLVRDLAFYQIAAIDTKELIESTDNNLFYKGARIAAHKKDLGIFSGIVAETSCEYNKFRILVFFDDGSIDYVNSEACHMTFGYQNNRSRKVEDTSAYKIPNVYINQRRIIYKFLDTNLRILLKLETETSVKIKINNKVYKGTVKSVDCSIATILYSKTKELSLYRGSQQFVDVQKYLETIKYEVPYEPDARFDYHWADVERRWSAIDFDYSSKLTTSNLTAEQSNDNPSETVVNENTEEKDERNLLPDTTKFDESAEDSDDLTLLQIKTANKKVKRKRKIKNISEHSALDENSSGSSLSNSKKKIKKGEKQNKNKKQISDSIRNGHGSPLLNQKKNIKNNEKSKKNKKQISNTAQNGPGSSLDKKRKKVKKNEKLTKNKKQISNTIKSVQNGSGSSLPKQKKNNKKVENPNKNKKQISSTVNGKKSVSELTSIQKKIILNEVQQNKKGKKLTNIKKYSQKSKYPKKTLKNISKLMKKVERSPKNVKSNQKSQNKVTKNKTMHRRKLDGLPDTLKSYHNYKRVLPEHQKKRNGIKEHKNVLLNKSDASPPRKRQKLKGQSKN